MKRKRNFKMLIFLFEGNVLNPQEMNSLLPSPTLIDLSLRHDLHLIIVLQVTASVPESFVEIGVWGGKKKKSQ